jgi:hypothetical protein
MSKPEPRSSATIREIEYQLRLFLQTESVEILARVLARIIARDPSQFTQLTDQFKHAFGREHEYLNSRHGSSHERSHEGGVS